MRVNRSRAILAALVAVIALSAAYLWLVTPGEVRRYYGLRMAADAGAVLGEILVDRPEAADVGPKHRLVGVVPDDGDTVRLAFGKNTLVIVVESNGSVNFEHAELACSDPEQLDLIRLRKTLRLDAAIAGAGTDLEAVLRIADRVCEALPREGTHVRRYAPEYDVWEMLSDAGRGAAFQCDELTAAFIQAAASVGFTARTLSMQRRAGDGHAVAEIWLDDARSWVLYDLLYERYYEIDGTAASAIDLKRLLDMGMADTVDAISRIDGERVREPGGFVQNAEYYNSIAFGTRSNYIERRDVPRWHPDANHVAADVLWEESHPVEQIRYHHVTSDSGYVYFPLNETMVAIDTVKSDRRQVLLRLSTETPGFDGFVTRHNGESRRSVVYADSLVWEIPRHAPARLSIRARNAVGKTGRATRLVAYVQR